MQPREDEFKKKEVGGSGAFQEITSALHAALAFYGVDEFFSDTLEGGKEAPSTKGHITPFHEKGSTKRRDTYNTWDESHIHTWNSPHIHTWDAPHSVRLLPFFEQSELFHYTFHEGHTKEESLKKERVLKSYIAQLFPTSSSVIDALFYDVTLQFEVDHVPRAGKTREILFDGLMEYIDILEGNKKNFSDIFTLMLNNIAFQSQYLKILLPHQRRIFRHILHKSSLGLGAMPQVDSPSHFSMESLFQNASSTLFSWVQSFLPQTMEVIEEHRLLFFFNNTILPTWIKDTTYDLSLTMSALNEMLMRE